ncbi:hypothetical protein WKH29_11450 [Pantoea agglomerans]|uniref:hypothetical protein n=1 Tax=Enterobacter agglomerans TaxID=549 RepID=UPI003C7CEE18
MTIVTLTKKQFNPLASVGDIVWCYIPHAECEGEPGPYPRPGLVVKRSVEDHAVMVVFGTSQKTDRVYDTEFVIRKGEAGYTVSGLARDTKFDMSRMYKLPYDSDWFDLAPIQNGVATTSPVMGVLHPSYMPALKKAHAKAVKAA